MKQFTHTFSEKVTNKHLFIFLIKTNSPNSFFTCTTVLNARNASHKTNRKNCSLCIYLYLINSTILTSSLLQPNSILIINILLNIQYIGSNLINIIKQHTQYAQNLYQAVARKSLKYTKQKASSTISDRYPNHNNHS